MFLLLLSCNSILAGTPVLTYGPSVVELVGILDVQTFPGPPSYESISDGDRVERHFYLKLDVPTAVVPKGDHPGVENAIEERKVEILQLSIAADDDALWARFRRAGKSRRVKITGTLFHRFTGHHHSRVLMSVDAMEKISSK